MKKPLKQEGYWNDTPVLRFIFCKSILSQSQGIIPVHSEERRNFFPELTWRPQSCPSWAWPSSSSSGSPSSSRAHWQICRRPEIKVSEIRPLKKNYLVISYWYIKGQVKEGSLQGWIYTIVQILPLLYHHSTADTVETGYKVISYTLETA